MSVNVYNGNFASQANYVPRGLAAYANASIADKDISANAPAWTGGAAQICPIPTQPALTEVWSLVAWSIACVGVVDTHPFTNSLAAYGRLGKLLGGVLIDAPFNTKQSQAFSGSSPWSVYWLNPVPSGAFQDTIWDGENDPLLPSIVQSAPAPSTFPAVQLAHTYTFPQPLDVFPGQTIAMALWLTPSLSTNIDITFMNATYTLHYQMGASPGPTGPAPQPR